MLALVTIIMFSSIYAREMQAFGLAARNDVRLPRPYDSKFAAHIAVSNFPIEIWLDFAGYDAQNTYLAQRR